MRIDFVRRSPNDVDAAAVGLPAGNARGKMLVGVGDAAVVLFFEIVLGQIGIAAAPQPELLDELLALFAGAQLQKRRALLGRNNVDHIFVEPLLVLGVQFLERPAHFFLLFLGQFLRCGRILGVGRWLDLLRHGERERKQNRESRSKEGSDYPGHRYTSTARKLRKSNAGTGSRQTGFSASPRKPRARKRQIPRILRHLSPDGVRSRLSWGGCLAGSRFSATSLHIRTGGSFDVRPGRAF